MSAATVFDKPAPVVKIMDEADAECGPKPAAIRKSSAGRRSNTAPAPDLPPPPFFGSRIVTDIPTEDVFAFLNERTLFSTQWQFRKGNADPAEYKRQMVRVFTRRGLTKALNCCMSNCSMSPKQPLVAALVPVKSIWFIRPWW